MWGEVCAGAGAMRVPWTEAFFRLGFCPITVALSRREEEEEGVSIDLV